MPSASILLRSQLTAAFLLVLGMSAAWQGAKAQEAPTVAGADSPATQSESSRPDVQEIIRRFVEAETAFKTARENYTYRQSVKVQELSPDGEVRGTYQMDADVIFTPQGNRVEKVIFAPLSTLKGISISPQDERDLRNIQPFVLTAGDLPKYDIKYQGRQKVDELDTYVFRVGPKKLEKGERYFEGIVWVDDRDYQIVKTYGKAVPDVRGGKENLFPRFETYREQIDGKYWFPTWTEADDTLYFSSGPVRIRMIVRYENYQQFKTDVNVTYGDEVPPQP
jgi:hypothetical protein